MLLLCLFINRTNEMQVPHVRDQGQSNIQLVMVEKVSYLKIQAYMLQRMPLRLVNHHRKFDSDWDFLPLKTTGHSIVIFY